ncbi:uncharacterized protein MELLADRAFT_78247 [Melampsora larici-populina 98AG31]|uniref:Uncharacterized protein n=1 Tax=Melampsora larici-populina (strain 98AG31 / pathotype 3-4-7) TaxID=747676 RepID=F4RRZ1_MELLP|nr:uncharacterized protein MELLADRAFT_78247 [Melampsora larici-populina 98AG31]EGG04764.1 hypothetical protein MELLADRAFT_78247 [Melampsora larici-populina 98AG31]
MDQQLNFFRISAPSDQLTLLIWLVLESLAQHQELTESEKIKLTYARSHDTSTNEPQSLASSSSPTEHPDSPDRRSGCKITLPINTSFLKTYGISKVLPQSIGRDAILEAEVGLLELQKRLADFIDQEFDDTTSEISTLELFHQLRIQCEIFSPFAGDQATSNRSSAHTDHKRTPNDDGIVGEIKGPGYNQLVNLVNHSIPLMLNPMGFEAQLRAYRALYSYPSLELDALRGGMGRKCASTVLDARIMVYFVGLVQSLATYLLKGVATVVERDPSRMSVRPHDLLVFIGEDELMTGFWDLFELTRTKACIDRMVAATSGGSYHHRTGSFGRISPDTVDKVGLGIGASRSANAAHPSHYAYLFTNHHLYISALQRSTVSRSQSRPPRKSHDQSNRAQSIETHRSTSNHLSSSSISSPSTTSHHAPSPVNSFSAAVYHHPAQRKPNSRNTSQSSSHYTQLSPRDPQATGSPALVTVGIVNPDAPELLPGATLKRTPSFGKRSKDRSSSAISRETSDHAKKWSLSSASNHGHSDSQAVVSPVSGHAAARSMSSTSRSSVASSQQSRRLTGQASFSNMKAIIQGQSSSSSRVARSRSRTAGSGHTSRHHSTTSPVFEASKHPIPSTPSSLYEDTDHDRREFLTMSPQDQFRSFNIDPSADSAQSTTDHKTEWNPNNSSNATETLVTRPSTSPTKPLQPRTERLPQHRKRVSEQQARPHAVKPEHRHHLSSSATEGTKPFERLTEADEAQDGESQQSVFEDDDDDNLARPGNMTSLVEALKIDPPWVTRTKASLTSPPSVSSLLTDSPAPSTQSLLRSKKPLTSFSMKKANTSGNKKRSGDSSINLKQISQPSSLLYSSVAISQMRTEPLPQASDKINLDMRHRSQNSTYSMIEDNDNSPATDAISDEAIKPQKRGLKSLFAKLKGRDDLPTLIRSSQPQFVSSAIGGINPRVKAAGGPHTDFHRSLPTPSHTSSAIFPRPQPGSARTARVVDGPMRLRAQKSSPMISTNAHATKVEAGPRSATLFPNTGFDQSHQDGPRRAVPHSISTPIRPFDIREMRTPSKSPTHLSSDQDTQSHRITPPGWEMNIDVPPPVPSLPSSAKSIRESYESDQNYKASSSSSVGRSSVDHTGSLCDTSPISKDGKSARQVPAIETSDGGHQQQQQELLTPPTDFEQAFVYPFIGLSRNESQTVKQRTITAGSNSSEASNQTVKYMNPSPVLHALLASPISPLRQASDRIEKSERPRRISLSSAHPSLGTTAGPTSTSSCRDSSSTNSTSCTSELVRQEFGGMTKEGVEGTEVMCESSPFILHKNLKSIVSPRSASGVGSSSMAGLNPMERTSGSGVAGEGRNQQEVQKGREGEMKSAEMRTIAALDRVKAKIGIFKNVEEVMEAIEEEQRQIELEILRKETEEEEELRESESVVGWLLDS